MSGVAIIRYMLANDAALVSAVSASNIVAGNIRLNTALPAVSIVSLSATQRNTVSASSSALVTEYVQITVIAKSYQMRGAILALVRAALPRSRGTINGFTCDSILPEFEGPEIEDSQDDTFIKTLDYVVKFAR